MFRHCICAVAMSLMLTVSAGGAARATASPVAGNDAKSADADRAASDRRRAKALERVDVEAAPLPAPERAARSATRLDLSVRETPASVDVIAQRELRGRFETMTVEALDNAPGVVGYYSFGTLNISGRGFAGVFNSPTLYDGIRYPGWQLLPRSTLNYAQVEVLRGPAALSAGQGAIAGAINLVPRRAETGDARSAYAGYGRYGTTTLALGQGGSVGAGPLRYRIDLAYQGSNRRGSYGYARDTSFEFRHLSADFALPVGDELSLGLAFESYRDDAEGYFGSPLIGGRVDERLREINYNVVDDRIDMAVDWLRARARWQPSAAFGVRAVLFANREDRNWRNTEAYTFRPATGDVRRADYLEIRHDQRLRGALLEADWRHSLFGRPHQWVLGVQADRNDHDRANDSPFRFNDVVPLFPRQRGVYRSIDRFGPRTATDIEQRALYFESRLDLGDRTRVISGLRHDRTEVESFNALSGVRFDRRYVSNGWRFAVTHEPFEQATVYVSRATSSEPPAQITTLGLANAAFDLTDGRQWEIGWKQAFARGDWTAAVYDLERTNILSRDPADPNRLIQVGEQKARGLELSARLALGERLALEGHAALLDAEFGRFDERVGGAVVSRRGNRPVNVPERVGTLWLRWQGGERWAVALGARAVGSRAANTANTIELPGYATLDANLSYDTRWGRFGARVRNLTDRLYATTPFNAANQAMLGEPRWYELVWQRQF